MDRFIQFQSQSVTAYCTYVDCGTNNPQRLTHTVPPQEALGLSCLPGQEAKADRVDLLSSSPAALRYRGWLYSGECTQIPRLQELALCHGCMELLWHGFLQLHVAQRMAVGESRSLGGPRTAGTQH